MDAAEALGVTADNSTWDVVRACPACGGRGWADAMYTEPCYRCLTTGYVVVDWKGKDDTDALDTPGPAR